MIQFKLDNISTSFPSGVNCTTYINMHATAIRLLLTKDLPHPAIKDASS